MQWFDYIYNPIFLGFLWIIAIEILGFRLFYKVGWLSLTFRVILLNLYSISTLVAFAIVGTLLDYWPFILNWGIRDLFLAILAVEIPMAFVVLPRSPFKKAFSAIVLVNFMSSLIASLLVIYLPPAVGIRGEGASQFYAGDKASFGEIINALEKYKKDKGYYPSYIYGGDRLSWMKLKGEISDPLIAENYLPNYPRNGLNLERGYFRPRRAPGLNALFVGKKSLEYIEIYNTWYYTLREDPRFGFRGTKMGNVLSDPTIPQSFEMADYKLVRKGYSTGRNYILPGGFIYRSFDLNNDTHADAFFIALLGGEDEKGMDLYDRQRNLVAEKTISPDGKPSLKLVSDGYPDGIIEYYLGGKGYWTH